MTHAKKLYNYMLLVTNSGGCLPIEDRDGDVKIFFKGLDGKIKQTEWESSLENAKNSREIEDCYSKEDFIYSVEEYNWKPLTPYRIPTEPLPIGTKVRVNENAEEECEKAGIICCSEMRDMIGEVYEITNSNMISVICGGICFSISAVTPVFEHNERTVDDILNELSEEDKQILKDKLK